MKHPGRWGEAANLQYFITISMPFSHNKLINFIAPNIVLDMSLIIKRFNPCWKGSGTYTCPHAKSLGLGQAPQPFKHGLNLYL